VPFVVAPLFLPLLSRRHCLPCRANAAFIVAPPFLPSLSGRRFCLRRHAAAPFIVAPPFLPLSSRRRCLSCGATSPFIVAPPLPSSSPPLILAWFCRHRCTAAAFLVAPPLPSLSRRRSPHRHAILIITILRTI